MRRWRIVQPVNLVKSQLRLDLVRHLPRHVRLPSSPCAPFLLVPPSPSSFGLDGVLLDLPAGLLVRAQSGFHRGRLLKLVLARFVAEAHDPLEQALRTHQGRRALAAAAVPGQVRLRPRVPLDRCTLHLALASLKYVHRARRLAQVVETSSPCETSLLLLSGQVRPRCWSKPRSLRAGSRSRRRRLDRRMKRHEAGGRGHGG